MLEDVYAANLHQKLLAINYAESAAITFQSELTSILDHYAPVRITQRRARYCPQITDSTKEEIIMKNMMVKYMRSTGLEEDW